jgi:hypothetical protein
MFYWKQHGLFPPHAQEAEARVQEFEGSAEYLDVLKNIPHMFIICLLA